LWHRGGEVRDEGLEVREQRQKDLDQELVAEVGKVFP
jgi:hypothetical protein